jgi:hypothetical protein
MDTRIMVRQPAGPPTGRTSVLPNRMPGLYRAMARGRPAVA